MADEENVPGQQSNNDDGGQTEKPAEGTEPKPNETGAKDGAPKKEGDADANKDGKGEDSKGEGSKAPEEYTAFELPEGTSLDEETLGKFTSIVKGKNFTQEEAQELISLASGGQEKAAQAQQDYWKGVREGWVKELNEDKEFGGEKVKETTEQAKRTLKAFGSDNLKTFLEESGFGDNADMVRMLAKIDKALGEDKVVNGNPPSGGSNKSAAETIYPNS